MYTGFHALTMAYSVMSANDDHDIMYVTWQDSSSEESSSKGSDEPEGRLKMAM